MHTAERRRPLNHLFRENLKKLLIFILVCMLSLGAFFCLYSHDNKYTARSVSDRNGITGLDSDTLNKGKAAFLVEGWDLYPGVLLPPSETHQNGVNAVQTFIGQYPTFAPFQANQSPYGVATYHLRLRLDGDPGTYTLLLPEVFSASEVYVNGKPAGGSGSISPYKPCIRDLVCDIDLNGITDLVIHTANYTHYYSGITYPPAVGTAQTIHTMISIRMIIYAFLAASSLAVALFSVAVWAGTRTSRRDSLSLWFAGLAVSFVLRILYPFLHLEHLPVMRLLYALEDGAAMAAILCTFEIVYALGRFQWNRGFRLCRGIAFGMTAVCILIPLIILPELPAFTTFYGRMISWYKLAAAITLCLMSLLGKQKQGALWLMGGVTAYAVSLLLTPLIWNLFEPIYGCWPDEYGSYLLVICFSILMVQRTYGLVRENTRLTAHLEEEVEKQTRQISSLVDERQKLLSEFLHDLKSPVSSLMTYTNLIRKNSIMLNEATEEQLRIIEEKSRDVSQQITLMQEFTAENPMKSNYQILDLNEFLETFYRYNKPDVEANGPDFLLNLPEKSCRIRADAAKLKRVLQNMVYNSVSFTPEDGTISLSLELSDGWAVLSVRDNGCGIARDIQEKLFDRSFTTRQQEGGRGLGLYIAKTIVEEHGGSISVYSRPEEGAVFHIRLPL